MNFCDSVLENSLLVGTIIGTSDFLLHQDPAWAWCVRSKPSAGLWFPRLIL